METKTVWILYGLTNYEPAETLGVFSTEALAKKAKEKYAAGEWPRTMGRDATGARERSEDKWGFDDFRIEDFEVDAAGFP